MEHFTERQDQKQDNKKHTTMLENGIGSRKITEWHHANYSLKCKSVGFRGFFFFFFYDAEIFLYIVLFVFADGAHSQSEGGGPFHNI